MGKVVVFDHPLIQHKLSIIRNQETDTKTFRENVNEIGSLVTFEGLSTKIPKVFNNLAE